MNNFIDDYLVYNRLIPVNTVKIAFKTYFRIIIYISVHTKKQYLRNSKFFYFSLKNDQTRFSHIKNRKN